MTHRLQIPGVNNHLPLPKYGYVWKPFYSLFKKVDGKWQRCSLSCYSSEKTAWNIFSSRIAEAPLSHSIRVVRVDSTRAGKHRGVTYNPLRDSPMRERVSK